MAKVIIPKILQSLKSVRHSNAINLNIRYDEAADVVYVSFGSAIAADDSQLDDDDILYRYKNAVVIGLTITNFNHR